MRDVVLAAAIDFKRAVGKHRAAVVDRRRMIGFVERHLVRAGEIVQPLPVRRERGGQRIKREFLATIGPNGVAGDFREHLEAVHELDDAAGLETLMRIGETRSRIFVRRKSAAGELAVKVHHRFVIALGGAQEFFVPRLEVIDAGLAKALGDVHVVPVVDAAGPVLHVVVNPLRQVEKEAVAGVEVERPSTEQFHQFLARFFEHLEFSKSRKLRIPLDSGRVIQEMPNRDVIALCRVAGKKLRHLVRERKLSLFGQ